MPYLHTGVMHMKIARRRAAPLIRAAHVVRRSVVTAADLLRGEDVEALGAGPTGGRSVLVVTTLRRFGSVGVNTHIAQVEDLLAQQGVSTRVLSLDSWLPVVGPLLLTPSLFIRRAKFTRGMLLDRYLTRQSLELSIRRHLKAQHPRVFYAQDPRSAYAALRARGTTGIPVILVIHYNESEAEELVNHRVISRHGRTDRAIRRFEAAVLPRLDGMVFVSDFMRQHLQNAIPAARAVPYAIIPNFLHDVSAPPATPTRDFISVGYLVERKNHAYLLRVLAAASLMGHRYTLTLVGDGPERGRLQRLARQLGLADQVDFLGQRHDVDHLLRQHRLYVHSSLMENCPFALLEAFRAGVPVVAAPVGGIPEVLDESAGRFWSLNDAVGGARLVTELLQDPAAREQMGRHARQLFESTYDAVVVADQFAQFLELTGAPRPGPSD